MIGQSFGLNSRVALFLVAAGAVAAFAVNHGSAQRAPAAKSPETLLGEWWTEDNQGRVRFTKDKDGTYRGTTTCCVPKKPSEDHPAIDSHNPNPKLRARSTVGIVLIWKLRSEGDGSFEDGYVYNPRDGKTYRFDAEIIDKNTLKIRGYAGISLFGQSQIWKRVAGSPQP